MLLCFLYCLIFVSSWCFILLLLLAMVFEQHNCPFMLYLAAVWLEYAVTCQIVFWGVLWHFY